MQFLFSLFSVSHHKSETWTFPTLRYRPIIVNFDPYATIHMHMRHCHQQIWGKERTLWISQLTRAICLQSQLLFGVASHEGKFILSHISICSGCFIFRTIMVHFIENVSESSFDSLGGSVWFYTYLKDFQLKLREISRRQKFFLSNSKIANSLFIHNLFVNHNSKNIQISLKKKRKQVSAMEFWWKPTLLYYNDAGNVAPYTCCCCCCCCSVFVCPA